MNASHPGLTPAVLLCCLVAACGRTDVSDDSASSGQGEVTPLTREEIEQQAEAMSPEVAESLGIVDTTIGIESPVSPETLVLPGTAPDSIPPL